MWQQVKCESTGFKLILMREKYKHGVNCIASSPLALFRMDFLGAGATQKAMTSWSTFLTMDKSPAMLNVLAFQFYN